MCSSHNLYIQPEAWHCIDTTACLSRQPIASSKPRGRRTTCKRDANTESRKEKKFDLRLLALAITDASPTVSSMMAMSGDNCREIAQKTKMAVEVSD